MDRRRFLRTSGVLAAGLSVAGVDDVLAQGALPQELAPTPECRDNHEPTVRQGEGPFFKPRSPERADLREAGARGRPVELSGVVLTRSCRPVARALIDLWHADDAGDYDNTGFRYSGHQYTDADGRFRFRTIVPALYPGRTRHYHAKVQAAGGRLLTTQLYFPDEAGNRRDGMFRPELLMRTAPSGDGLAAWFDFVLDMR